MLEPVKTSIHKLPDETVHQIAAGEVVERPAHLLKELVENSIDAGAKHIDVHFSQGGKHIFVKDDGHGIAKEALPLALARHATSKIQTTDDLWSLKSFGFRGEALASIAAVSHTTITSATKTGQGHSLTSIFGKTKAILPTHTDPGTSVKVTNLFGNCPARLKFLKSQASEALQIKKTFKALAIIHPHITFKLLQDKQLLHYFPATSSFHERAKQVLDDPDLYYLKEDHLHFQCELVYGRPSTKQKNSQNIWLFVQRRWVQDLQLKMAIIESYRTLLMHGTYPIAVLHLTCDPAEIDVNIHPTKSQVKFKSPTDAFRAVSRPLRKNLEKAPWLKGVLGDKDSLGLKADFLRSVPQKKYHQHTFAEKPYPRSSPTLPSEKTLDDFLNPQNNIDDVVQFPQKPSFSHLLPKPPPQMEPPLQKDNEPQWGSLQVLGQCNLTYIMTQSRKSLILIDQHAAHERVAFERLMNSWKKKQFDVQKKLQAHTFTLEPSLCENLIQHKSDFKEIGIELEQIGPSTLAISSQPAILSDKSLMHALKQAAQQIEDMAGSFAIEKVVGDLFATMACHSVIRAGQALSHEEMQSLLKQMDAFSLSSFCPHGRPVFTQIPFSQLDREFGRIV